MQIATPFHMAGQTVLVTGASSGIGRAACIVLSRLGARLVLSGRDRERLNLTLRSLDGCDHLIEPFDLTELEDIPSWLKSVGEKSGPLGGLVHCAGTQITVPLRLTTAQKVAELMGVHACAAIALARGFRQKEVCARGSSIVLVSSVMGLVGQPGRCAYSAAKGALVALTRSLAVELAREQIRVNCVAPGVVLTEMTQDFFRTLTEEQVASVTAMHPLGLGTPEDVAYSIAFLLSGAARWITGSTLVVDGGYTAH